MKSIFNQIYTIITLIKNLIFQKKYHKLHFIAINDELNNKRWYYDFKHWGFNYEFLEMVAGADQLCELYANGKNELTINIISTNKLLKTKPNNYNLFVGETPNKNTTWKEKLLYGRTYKLENNNNIIEMWICPVTLFVLGKYPNYLYVNNPNNVKL